MFKTEAIETYKGYTLVCNFLDQGHRCGYVGLPKDHPLCCVSLYRAGELLTSPHGGISFSEPVYNNYPISDNKDIGWWLGFDCNHGCDGKDFDLVEQCFGVSSRNRAETLAGKNVLPDSFFNKPIMTTEEVMENCRELADEIERLITKEKDKDDKDDTQMERD